MAAMMAVTKIPIRPSAIGPAASSPVNIAKILKYTIKNKMKIIIVNAHFFITFKDLRDTSEKALFILI